MILHYNVSNVMNLGKCLTISSYFVSASCYGPYIDNCLSCHEE